MSQNPTLLTAPAFVVGMVYASVVIGRRVLLIFGARHEATPSEKLVIGGAIGLGALQFVPFALGALGVLSTTVLSTTLVVIVLICLLDLRAIVAAANRWWHRRRPLHAWEWAWLVLLAAPVFAAFFDALLPSFDPDGVGYHLMAAKRWLDLGSLAYLPTMTYTNGPMGSEMLYASALALVGDAGAKLLHMTAALLAAGGVYLLGSRVGKRVRAPMVGHVACALFLFSPFGIYTVMATSFAEGTATLAIVASTLCWMLWFDSAKRAWLGPAALLAGTAVTFKLTAVVFPVALAVLTILIVRRRGREETGTAGLGWGWMAGLAGLCVAPMLPWMIRSTLVVGNPVFPVLARWIPSKNFPPDVASAFESYNRYMIWGTSWGYHLSLDERRLLLVAMGLVVLLIGGVVYWRLRDPTVRAVTIVVVGTTVVQLLAAGLYLRYWVPLAAVLQIPVLALILVRLDRRIALSGMLLLTLVLSVREVRPWLDNDPGSRIAASVDSRARERISRKLLPLASIYEAANAAADEDETVLMGFGCGGFYLDGPSVCADTLETSLRMGDWDDFNDDLDRLGVRYVIAPTFVADGKPLPPLVSARAVADLVREEEYDSLSRLLEERGQLMATAADFGLYRLAPR